MPTLAVDFVEADEVAAGKLAEQLSDRGFPVHRVDNVAEVSVSSFEDCNALAKAIADFIAGSETRFPLHIDGPGGESLLSRVGTTEDARIISGLLATCAGFQ